MKNPRFKNYMYWGTTALAVIALSVAFGFFLSRFELVSGALGKIASILMPIIYGAVLAYLMLPIYNKTRSYTNQKLGKAVKDPSIADRIAKGIATLVSLIVLVVIVAGLFRMIIPEIYKSILRLQESIGEYINNLTMWMNKLFEDNQDFEQFVMPYYEQGVAEFQKWLTEKLVPNMSMIIGQLSTGLLSVVTVVKNILIGVIVMVYFLNIKDTLSAQSKKIVYSVLKLKDANRLVSEVRFAHGIFGGFITGKLLDSLIIGIMCFFAMQFMGMPYVLLISVIIGVTNVIPFFGPFIGAVPSAFLILMISPMKCLYFLIFILVLQQFDGNILGPLILGDKLGLPSIGILFSVCVGGGLFGVIGMFIGVPCFAVIYMAVKEFVNYRLKKKAVNLDEVSKEMKKEALEIEERIEQDIEE